MNKERRRLEYGPQEALHEDSNSSGLRLSMAGAFTEYNRGTEIAPERSATTIARDTIAKGRATALGPRLTEFHTIAIAYERRSSKLKEDEQQSIA
jgi:hypothetical protein